MKVKQEVLEVLSQAWCDDKELRLVGQLDRKLYVETNKVLEACGGKWNRKQKAHVFEEEAQPLVDTVILTGEVRTHSEDGWFPTPPELADRVVVEARIEDGMSVLEPSAGEGALVMAVRRASAKARIVAVEFNQRRFDKLFAARFDADPIRLLGLDFMQLEPSVLGGPFDRVVMNPPFAKGQDADHVTRALSLLRPGGRLVAIMASAVAFRTDRRYVEFRGLIADHGGLIEPLPDGSFTSSGTAVRTVLVAMTARG